MNDLISRQALCEYALNQKGKCVTPNDIMRFPSAQPETHEKRTETHSCDLIKRQQAIDAVVSAMIDGADAELVEGVMELLPSAQPEIIRCKDCKNWDTTWINDFSPNYHYCPMVDGVRKEDWYCGDAERRSR